MSLAFKLLLVLVLQVAIAELELDQAYWRKVAKEELHKSLNIKLNKKRAKNVIIFIGDGMGPVTITASRIYNGGETSKLVFEEFPHVGLLKTYVVDKQVPDSASTATSMFTGVKNNFHTLGVDKNVKEFDCQASLKPENRLSSISGWAQDAGKATGFVTTTRITHATPAALYAYSPSRKWECDSKLPPSASQCKDIARQLIEDLPGKNFNVIMGGGRQVLQANLSSVDVSDVWTCNRTDGKDLIKDWAKDKIKRGVKYLIANNTGQLPGGKTNVEGGLIDQAHHRGIARKALDEVVAFNKAINGTMQLLKSLKIKDETLVIVTSDHTHTLAMNGYPARGNNILGIASYSKIDQVPFTTLTYALSGPENYKYSVVNNTVVREDPSTVNTTSFTFHQQAGILNHENNHGGGDVNIYATGPMAHLFHSVHEQNYVASVIAYASKIGPHGSSAVFTPSLFLILSSLCIKYI